MAGIAVLYVCEWLKCSLEDCHGSLWSGLLMIQCHEVGNLLFENGVFSTFSFLSAELQNFTMFKTSSNNHSHYSHIYNAYTKVCEQHCCSSTSSFRRTNRAISPPIAPTNFPPTAINTLLPSRPPSTETHTSEPPPSRKEPSATR